MNRRSAHTVATIVVTVVWVAICPVLARAADILLKNGTSYLGVSIIKQSQYSVILRTSDRQVKQVKLSDIKEIDPVSRKQPVGNAAGTISTTVPGFYAFRDANGKQVLTNRPEEYDPNFFEPVMVPLDKVTLYRSAGHGSGRSGGSPGSSGNGYNPTTTDIDKLIKFHASRNGISESLVRAVIKAESGGDPRAQSRCGACGLMQLMPGTAAEMGIYDLFDPDENIAGGTEYLSKMMEMFDGHKELALAAYNAGPGAVKKYGGVPPYSETRNYVRRVMRYEQDFQRGARLQIASASGSRRPAPPALSETNPTDFAITTKNGITIRGTSYKKLASGIQIKTSRKWEFVPNDSIRATNFS